MFLRAGGIHQRRTELFRWMHPQLHAQTIIEFDAGFGRSLSQHAMDARQFDKHIHHCGGIFRGDQDIQVADRVTHPPQTSTGLRIDNALHLFEFSDQRLCNRDRRVPGESVTVRRESDSMPFDDRGFALGAHARKVAQFAFLVRRLRVLRRS